LAPVRNAAEHAKHLHVQAVAHWQKLANGDFGRSESSLESARRLGRLGDGLLSAEKHRDAAKACEQAVARWQKLAEAYPATPEYRRQLAFAHANRGIAVQSLGLLAEAEKAPRQALTLQQQLATESQRFAPEVQLRDDRPCDAWHNERLPIGAFKLMLRRSRLLLGGY